MILIKAQCTGIKPSIIKTYFLQDDIDEVIFFNTFNKINTKLERKIPINLDESVWFYCGYLINQIRNGISIDQIKKDIIYTLSADKLMIGVKEFLTEIYFEIMIGTCFKTKLMIKNLF
jgi:urease gamma subunit